MKLSSAAGVLCALAVGAAHAAPSCKITSVSSLAFGAYDVFSTAAVTSTSVLSYGCPPPTFAQMTISPGSSGSYAPRSMLGPAGDRLAYNVYQDAAMQTVWGPNPVTIPAAKSQLLTIYGQIFAQQDVTVGAYTDTLVITITF